MNRFLPRAPPLFPAAPSGNPSWERGRSHNIQWSVTGSITSVHIHLVRDGSASLLATRSASSGSWSWSIPTSQPTTSSYLIRVSSAEDASITSQQPLRIVDSVSVTLTRPSKTSPPTWIWGTTEVISWSSTGNPGTLAIQRITDSGSPVVLVGRGAVKFFVCLF